MARNDPNGWMIFQHAGPIELTKLRVEDVDIRDIAHGLNGINRFVGQTRYPISVLWHSLIVAELCRSEREEVQLEPSSTTRARPTSETGFGRWQR